MMENDGKYNKSNKLKKFKMATLEALNRLLSDEKAMDCSPQTDESLNELN